MVDGDNVSRVEVMMLRDAFHDTPIRKFFGGAQQVGWGWFAGMEFVPVPKLGKESVDRAVAMETVRLYLQNNVRSILLVSHDMDYGDTALHLRSMFDDLHVTIAANPRRVSQEYQETLQENGVGYQPLFDLQQPLLMARLFDLHRKLATKNPDGLVTLAEMGAAMIHEDQYMTRQLKKRALCSDLKSLGFFLTEQPLGFSPDGTPALVVTPDADDPVFDMYGTDFS